MIRADILDRAKQAVCQDRAATHGAAENTFGLIAALWSARLGQMITPAQVAILLVDLKTARAWGNPTHMDNWDDMAGYAACGGELAGAGHVPVAQTPVSSTSAMPKPVVAPAEQLSEPMADPVAVAQPVTIIAAPYVPVQRIETMKYVAAPMKPIEAAAHAAAPSPPQRAKVPHPSGPPWSTDDDARAVAIYAEAVAGGVKIGDAQRLVAETLGRPIEGTKSRLNKKLKLQVVVALSGQTATDAAKIVRAKVVAAGVSDYQGAAVKPAAPVSPVAPKPAPAPAPTPAPSSGLVVPTEGPLTGTQRTVRAHLNTLGNIPPFSPQDDLDIAMMLCSGSKIDLVSTSLGLDSKLIKDRWHALTGPILDPKGRIELVGQQALLVELKRRAALSQGKAA